jgi:hypothetical protein
VVVGAAVQLPITNPLTNWLNAMEPSTVDALVKDLQRYLNENRDSLPAENQKLLERALSALEEGQGLPPPGGKRRQILKLLSLWFLRECVEPGLFSTLEFVLERLEDVM